MKKPTYADRLKHVSRELAFVLENDKLSDQTKVTLERLVDEVNALHPPAGVRSVEIHSAFKKPRYDYVEGQVKELVLEEPEGQIDVVLAANDGDEVHFRVCGVVEIIKPEPEVEYDEQSCLSDDELEFADKYGIPYEELAAFSARL